MNELRLLAKADRRVRLGHAWVFSNEVDTARTTLTAFAPGELAAVRDAYGKPVGIAYVNPGALICARMLTSDVRARIDADWWTGRIRRAAQLRERIYEAPYYRAVYGESDGTPGVVVDRYADVLAAQLNTAGALAMKTMIVTALERVFSPRGILVRSAGSVRQLEGIDEFDEVLGDVPEMAAVREGGVTLNAPLLKGQKTGYFFDQRDNRSRLERYAGGRSVLDLYSYVGAWGIRAAAAGAQGVTCVDSSGLAIELARENAALNGAAVEAVRGDTLDVLEAYAAEGRRFGVIVADPPALIKRKRDTEAGQAHYERLNRLALAVLEPDGLLVSCSCSHHLEPAMLQRAILGAARSAGRRVQILERHAHAPDHPIHPAMPETEYLKAFFVRG